MEGNARTHAGECCRRHPYGRNFHAHVHRVHGRGSPAFVLEIPQFRLVQRGETLEGCRRARTLCARDTCALYPELQPVPVFPVLGGENRSLNKSLTCFVSIILTRNMAESLYSASQKSFCVTVAFLVYISVMIIFNARTSCLGGFVYMQTRSSSLPPPM